MNLLGKLTFTHERLSEAYVLDWLLDRVLDEQNLELPDGERHVTALFDADTLNYLLDAEPPESIGRLLETLPEASFAPVRERLEERWRVAADFEVVGLARVLVHLHAENALTLFAHDLRPAARTRDVQRLVAIGIGLCRLAPALGGPLVGAYLNAIESAGEPLEMGTALAVLHGRSDARHRLAQQLRGRRDDSVLLGDLYELVSPDASLDTVHHFAGDDLAIPFATTASAFAPGAPIAALAEALRTTAPTPLSIGAHVHAARLLPLFAPEDAPALYLAGVIDSHLLRTLDPAPLSARD